MKRTKVIMSFALALTLAFGLFYQGGYATVKAASEDSPAKPAVTIKSAKDDTAVKITISETEGADGYRIYMKSPSDTKYKKIKTLKKDGTEARSYTVKNLEPGDYSFRVKAYSKESGSTVWSSYSKGKKIELEPEEEKQEKAETGEKTADTEKPEETAEKEEPRKTGNGPYDLETELQKNADKGSFELKKSNSNDTIALGRWDCDERGILWLEDIGDADFTTDGMAETLEWEVLEYSADRTCALVISKYIICNKAYHDVYDEPVITWENCTLREWLNGEFYDCAFTEEEKGLIQQTHVVTEANDMGIGGGADTVDHIFLLSIPEVRKYYPSEYGDQPDMDRACAQIDGILKYWYTRTPGKKSNWITTVTIDGGISTDGGPHFLRPYFGVRPAFWISLTDDIVRENELSVGGYDSDSGSKTLIMMGAWDTENGEGDTDGIKEEIAWQILKYDEMENRVLLISNNILFWRTFNDTAANVSWEKSDLRKWLNSDFLEGAFSSNEQKRIALTAINDAGKKTTDKIFILSADEVDKYFPAYDRHAYAKNRQACFNDKKALEWMLRTPGINPNTRMVVMDWGEIYEEGFPMDLAWGIRPAMWLDLNE